MKLNTPGIIIKETAVGENDKLLVVLTAENGLIRAFADGARRIKGRNSAATSILCYGNFSFYKSKDTYKVDDSSPIEMFFDIRYNLEGLSLAQYFCELVLRQIPEGNESPEFLRLLLNSLFLIMSEKKPPELIKAVYEMRFASIAGYMPDLTDCGVCGQLKEKIFYFDYVDGGVFCENCKKPDGSNGVFINSTVLSAMRHIIYSPFEKIFSFIIPKKDMKQLSVISERYIAIQTEFNYKTLDFYKSVMINPVSKPKSKS